MFEVQFFSNYADKWVTISKHKKLTNAVKKAREWYVGTDHANKEITILFTHKGLASGFKRLTMYGTEQVHDIDYGL